MRLQSMMKLKIMVIMTMLQGIISTLRFDVLIRGNSEYGSVNTNSPWFSFSAETKKPQTMREGTACCSQVLEHSVP